MQVSVAFRHMDPSPAVQRVAAEKLEHVMAKYVAGMDVDAQATFLTERFLHVANFTINVNGHTVKCVEKNEDMYAAIDLALDRIERQLRRYKTRLRNHRPDQGGRAFTMKVLAVQEDEAGEVTQTGEYLAVADDTNETPPVRAESYTAPFMTEDEAVMQLELRHAPFFVFTNPSTQAINIVYQRDDGMVGLIVPEAAAE